MQHSADELIQQAEQAQKEKRLTDARQFALEASTLLRQQNDKLKLAKTLRYAGELARKLRDPGEAQRLYEEAVSLLREVNEPLVLAHTVRHLGDVHHDAGRPAAAKLCYDEALAIYRGHPAARPLDFANALRSAAVLEEEAGHTAEARQSGSRHTIFTPPSTSRSLSTKVRHACSVSLGAARAHR